MKVAVVVAPSSIIPFRGRLLLELRSIGAEIQVIAPFTRDDSETVHALRESMMPKYTRPAQRAGANIFLDFTYLINLIVTFKRAKPDMIMLYHEACCLWHTRRFYMWSFKAVFNYNRSRVFVY